MLCFVSLSCNQVKKILFLHRNFPAQFKNWAGMFSNIGYDVKFICQTHFNRKLRGVERIKIKTKSGPQICSEDPIERPTMDPVEVSEQYKQAFESLSRSGWNPDVVISHSGWGCGYYVKTIWPDCNFISYLEWWFNPESDFFHYDNNEELKINKNQITRYFKRNQTIALELSTANLIIAPTQWQKDQLPKVLRDNCSVVFDGINFIESDFVNQEKTNEITLTYGTRGMEPIRAFPQFIKSLPEIVHRIPEITIKIAGKDKVNYGGKRNDGKSWGEWAKKFAKDNNISSNIEWVGYLNPNEYCKWLGSSWCHVYLSHPYVTSWSYLDAIASGTSIVASEIEALREFDYGEIHYVDHRNPDNISTKVVQILESAQQTIHHRRKFPTELTAQSCFDHLLRVTGLEVTTSA